MTTLPQTTSARLPQAGAPGGGFIHATGGMGPVPAFSMSGADVWRVIRANLWLIIILILVCGAAGYLANVLWNKYAPSYTAIGFLQVRTEILKDAVSDRSLDVSDTRLATMLRTQQQLLTSPQTFSAVLEKVGPVRETDWIKQFTGATATAIQDAKDDLERNFQASPVPDSALLRVRMTCRKKEDAKVIIDEIVGAHLQREKDLADSALTSRTSAIQKMKDDYGAKLRDLTQSIKKTQEFLAGQGAGVEGLFSAKQVELQGLFEGKLKLAGEAQEARSQYARAKLQYESGQTPPEAQRLIDNDPLVSAFAREAAMSQITRDIKSDSFGAEHKEVTNAAKIAKATADALEKQKEELRVKYSTMILASLEGIASEKEAHFTSVDKQIEDLKKQHVELGKAYSELLNNKDQAKDLSKAQQDAANLLAQIAASQSADSQTRIAWALKPEVPLIPSWPRPVVLIPAGILIGLLLSLGIAFLREFLDDTVRSPRDIGRVGQLNLLGIIQDEDDDPAVANAKLPIFDAPHSITAEQFRQVRTRLAHSSALETTRSIMVTGPTPLDGKTTVAANLAAGLALNGRKVLLVDANFRRPELHRLFGFSNEKGFSDVLNGVSTLDDCLHPTRIPNLTVLTSGPKPPNATELFESQLLESFIERALEEFDHVLFDSGPFLVVSESVAMAPRVDGVITVVRAHAESRGTLQRMRDGLRQVKAEHIGVVLNAVRAQGGGYYRSNIKTYYTYNNGD